MLKSKQVQSIALGVVILIAWTAAALINVRVPPQQQELVSKQVDVLELMSRSRDLPVDLSAGQ